MLCLNRVRFPFLLFSKQANFTMCSKRSRISRYFLFCPNSSISIQARMQSPAQAYAQTLNHTGDRPPLRSDSSQTPTGIAKSQRRSVQRPSLQNHNSFKRNSHALAGHNSNQNANVKDNDIANSTFANGKHTQPLNAIPQKTLIHLLQIKEEPRTC